MLVVVVVAVLVAVLAVAVVVLAVVVVDSIDPLVPGDSPGPVPIVRSSATIAAPN